MKYKYFSREVNNIILSFLQLKKLYFILINQKNIK